MKTTVCLSHVRRIISLSGGRVVRLRYLADPPDSPCCAAPHLTSPVCRRCKPMATAARSPILYVLVIALGTVLSCGTCPPAPFITSLSPRSATAGGDQFLLTVNGGDFRHDSVVHWSGSSRVTSFVSSHQLVAVITAADIAQPGTVLVFVFNPPESGTTFVSGLSAWSPLLCVRARPQLASRS